jgi:hypothetical protein
VKQATAYPIILLLFGIIIMNFNTTSGQSFDCELSYLTTIENYTVYEHTESGAIIFRAKFAVDADGCPRAYGPDNSGLDWTANAGYPGNWWGIATDSNGEPIIQGPDDPYPGMYISTTSMVCAGYPDTVVERYVDSETIPYIALPYPLQSLAGISMGDFCFVRNSLNDNTSYAYLADTGPSDKLGEGSMKLADRIGLNSDPRSGGTSSGVIDYIVFPQSGYGNGTCLGIEEIDNLAATEFISAGGDELVQCIDNLYELNCTDAVELTCGEIYYGTSSSDPSVIDSYGCNTWTETGPERVHTIIPQGNGTITATLSNYTGDLDVYILASCDPDDCIGTVTSEQAIYTDAVAGETYYVVVDADDGSGSSNDLIVDCPEPSGLEIISNDLKLKTDHENGVLQLISDNKEDKITAIYSMMGHRVSLVADNTKTVYINHLSEGIYIVEITQTNGNIVNLKFIK